MEMEHGYVKLFRKSLKSGLMMDHKLWTFWCWCLMRAAWEKKKVIIRDVMVELEPGDFIMGRKEAAKELKMSEQSIRTIVTKLLKYGNLTTRTTNRFTIVSVVNWHTYQVLENKINQQINPHLTSSQPAANHEEEYKNIRKNILVDNCNCPHQQIIDLYHEVLPELSKVRSWGETRRSHLRARWNEDKGRQSLDWWKKFFGYIRKSDFLMGRTEKPFRVNLEWIVKRSNFDNIIEGKYNP